MTEHRDCPLERQPLGQPPASVLWFVPCCRPTTNPSPQRLSNGSWCPYALKHPMPRLKYPTYPTAHTRAWLPLRSVTANSSRVSNPLSPPNTHMHVSSPHSVYAGGLLWHADVEHVSVLELQLLLERAQSTLLVQHVSVEPQHDAGGVILRGILLARAPRRSLAGGGGGHGHGDWRPRVGGVHGTVADGLG